MNQDTTFVKAGLILEGGGMRGVYTAGILDYFMERGVQFSSIYGVSAGAIHMCNYLSGQNGRGFRTSTNYLDDKNYCSVSNILKEGNMFGTDMCYNRIVNELDPFDYEAAKKYPGQGYAVATDIESGKPVYIKINDLRKDIIAIQASASLPLVSRNVMINGRPCLDGGVSDSIPIVRSMKMGNKKNVVVLTRPLGYIKKPTSNMGLIKMKYHKYPKLVEDMEKRHSRYNKTVDHILDLENQGKVFVFRPDSIIKINRIEKDIKKLKVLYLQGYHDAAINYDLMMQYLQS